jgi:hypothetical protein
MIDQRESGYLVGSSEDSRVRVGSGLSAMRALDLR